MNKETKIKLLEVYRKHNNYSLVKLLEDPNKCAICSRNTYRKLLNGEFIRFEDEIIESIFIRLKRPLITLPFTLDFKPLSKAMEYSFNDEAIIECQKLIDQLEPYKKNALYDVYYRQLTIILNYYQDNSCPNEEEVLKELDYMPMIEKELSDLVYVMFMYSFDRGLITNVGCSKLILESDTQHLMGHIYKFCNKSNELKYGDCIKMIEKIDSMISVANSLTLMYFLPFKIRVYQASNIDYEHLLGDLDSLLLKNIEKLNCNRRNILFANLVVVYLYKKSYQDALRLIDNIKVNDNIRRVHIEIYRMFCMSQLNIDYTTSIELHEDFYINYPIAMSIYDYFANIHISIRQKNNTLLKIARDKLVKDDILYYFMFEEEITKNCRILNRFKDLCDFKLTKDAKMNGK